MRGSISVRARGPVVIRMRRGSAEPKPPSVKHPFVAEVRDSASQSSTADLSITIKA